MRRHLSKSRINETSYSCELHRGYWHKSKPLNRQSAICQVERSFVVDMTRFVYLEQWVFSEFVRKWFFVVVQLACFWTVLAEVSLCATMNNTWPSFITRSKCRVFFLLHYHIIGIDIIQYRRIIHKVIVGHSHWIPPRILSVLVACATDDSSWMSRHVLLVATGAV